jgi:hypothetical protein
VSEGSFYELKEPTNWALAPTTFSFSSLQALKSCPRRWQFINSRWGEFVRFPERPQPAAIEGQIIHESLDMLAKEVGRIGRPPIGSPQFSSALERCKFWDFFTLEVNDWNARLKAHPRAGPRYVLRTKPRDLANQAVRLFREQYQSVGGNDQLAVAPKEVVSLEAATPGQSILSRLRACGALSELRLQHPSLPLIGVLDLVSVDASGFTTIVDFKTGLRRTAHEEQLRLYAMLWWRVTGDRPARVVIQYLDSTWKAALDESDLVDAEIAVEQEIRRANEELVRQPAPARVGEDCLWCAVRPRCDDGWAWVNRAKRPTASGPRTSISLQVTVTSDSTATGFLATQSEGSEVAIVFDEAVGRTLPPIRANSQIRIVDAAFRAEGKEIQISPWTEIYLT